MKKREGVVITATLALFYDQVVSCHEDTHGELFELAVDTAVANAKYHYPGIQLVEVNVIDVEAALDELKLRADRQIARLRAANELRGEA